MDDHAFRLAAARDEQKRHDEMLHLWLAYRLR
jgi:hypothetical protein